MADNEAAGEQEIKHTVNCICVTCQKYSSCDDICDEKYCVVSCPFYQGLFDVELPEGIKL